MWSWSGCPCRSDPGEPPARVFAEKEEMEEVVNQITFGPRNRIRGHLGRKPIPFYLTQSLLVGAGRTGVLTPTSSNRISVS
jgi:hypothetical protein